MPPHGPSRERIGRHMTDFPAVTKTDEQWRCSVQHKHRLEIDRMILDQLLALPRPYRLRPGDPSVFPDAGDDRAQIYLVAHFDL